MNKIIVTLLLCCSAHLTSAQTADSTAWRNVFTDPQLRNLIGTALEHNADLRTANLNVEQADAGLRMARLAMLPSLTVGVEGSLSKTKDAAATKTYNVPLTLQWEVDLSGRLRGEKRAALASYWSTAETERAVRLQLIASVATHYYTLVMMDEQLRVTRQSMGDDGRAIARDAPEHEQRTSDGGGDGGSERGWYAKRSRCQSGSCGLSQYSCIRKGSFASIENHGECTDGTHRREA